MILKHLFKLVLLLLVCVNAQNIFDNRDKNDDDEVKNGGPMYPASFSFAVNQAFIQNTIKAVIKATTQFQEKF